VLRDIKLLTGGDEIETYRKMRRMGVALGIFGLVAAVLVVLWVPACSAQSEPKPVVKVNDTVLNQVDLDRTLNELLPAMTFHSGVTPEKRKEYRDEALKRLINNELFYQEALRLDLKVEKEVKEARKSAIARVGGKKQYKKALKNAGLTEREYKEMTRKKLLVKKIREVEIEEKSIVSDEEARDYFEKNKNGYKRPEAWRLRHILVSVDPSSSAENWETRRKRAEEALQKIKDGEDMASVAWEYSDDPYRVKGGDLGIVHRGRLVSSLEEIVRKLDVGEHSDVVQTIYGYHIVKVEEKIESEQLEYEDVEKKIKMKLVGQRRGELEDKLIERLRAKASIEVY
jgi:peptidyl-prolyl cis-trans isomerase C